MMGFCIALVCFVLKGSMAVRDNFKVPYIPVLQGGGTDRTPSLFKVRGRRGQFDWLSPGMSCTPVECALVADGFQVMIAWFLLLFTIEQLTSRHHEQNKLQTSHVASCI